MMGRWATIVYVIVAAGLISWLAPLKNLFDAFSTVSTALSIMIAAIFVRLNRGMPTLDWKGLELGQRTRLTTAVVQLTREYAVIIGLHATFLLVLVSLSVVGKDNVDRVLSAPWQQAIAGFLGGWFALSVARMTYVVWRDIDIVRLQKVAIDSSTAYDTIQVETNAAMQKVGAMRAAGLRPAPSEAPTTLEH